ncbi:MAG: hypothetical protein WAX69_26635 [Victivallales bacterium]
MDENKKEDVNKVEESGCGCAQGCGCGPKGLSTKVKIIVCLVVLIAAGIVLGRGYLKKSAESKNKPNEAFAVTIPTSKTVPAQIVKEQAKASDKKQEKPKLWGEPLGSLESLNKVAGDVDAVFIFISGKAEDKNAAITKEIENAAGKFQAKGSTITAYTLLNVSKDYEQITKQVPAPCVLAMVKGKGMSTVSDDITEAKLLQALVTASRPSGCGPSACGPSTPGCP